MAPLLDEIAISQSVIQNPWQPNPQHNSVVSPIIPFCAPTPAPRGLIPPQCTQCCHISASLLRPHPWPGMALFLAGPPQNSHLFFKIQLQCCLSLYICILSPDGHLPHLCTWTLHFEWQHCSRCVIVTASHCLAAATLWSEGHAFITLASNT